MKNLYKIKAVFFGLHSSLVFIVFRASYYLFFEYIESLEIFRGYELISFLILDFFFIVTVIIICYMLNLSINNLETRAKLISLFLLFFIWLQFVVFLFVIILWFMAIVSPDTLLCTVGSIIKINRSWTKDQLKWILEQEQIKKSFYIKNVAVYDQILLMSETSEDVRKYFEAYILFIEQTDKACTFELNYGMAVAYFVTMTCVGMVLGQEALERKIRI